VSVIDSKGVRYQNQENKAVVRVSERSVFQVVVRKLVNQWRAPGASAQLVVPDLRMSAGHFFPPLFVFSEIDTAEKSMLLKTGTLICSGDHVYVVENR